MTCYVELLIDSAFLKRLFMEGFIFKSYMNFKLRNLLINRYDFDENLINL